MLRPSPRSHSTCSLRMFQSSSGLSTGCYKDDVLTSSTEASAVSILIRPFDRMLYVSHCRLRAWADESVSILIRPFDRMLRCCATVAARRQHFPCFNPHPAFRPDATLLMRHRRAEPHGWHSFNPHPAFRPDATLYPGRSEHTVYNVVSILIRPFDWMLPGVPGQLAHGVSNVVSILIRPFDRMLPGSVAVSVIGVTFQSSSGLSTGCYVPSNRPLAASKCFNPHPAFRPDATVQERAVDRPQLLFQSSSGLSTGCYSRVVMTAPAFPEVSILIRPFDRMLRERLRKRGPDYSVSILIRPFDRMLPGIPLGAAGRTTSLFQSSSGLSTGCYREGEGRRAGPGDVSILIRPSDRMLRRCCVNY